MTSGTASGKLTYDDYILIPEDGRRHEIIDGVHYVTPAPGRTHQHLIGTLYWAIRSFLEDHPIGEVYLSPFDVLLSAHDIVQPDVLFVRNETLHILNDKNAVGAPDLAIEVLSPSTRRRDRTLKRDLYQRSGVQEYWVVDPVRTEVAVHRRVGDRLAPPATLALSDHLTTTLLPGFELPLSRLFR
jgi:Uma2 family endonuclease